MLLLVTEKGEFRANYFYSFKAMIREVGGGSVFCLFLLSEFRLFLSTEGYVIFSIMEVSTVLLLFPETAEGNVIT